MMSQALRKLASTISKSNCLLIFINQIRQKVGIIFGNPEVTPGGNALKFYCSVRMDIRRRTPIKVNDEVVGYTTNVKVVKNKVAPPFQECSFDLYFKTGINKIGDAVDLATKFGLIVKSGAWYSNPTTNEKIGQGKEKCIKYLEEHPDEYKNILAEIQKKIYKTE